MIARRALLRSLVGLAAVALGGACLPAAPDAPATTPPTRVAPALPTAPSPAPSPAASPSAVPSPSPSPSPSPQAAPLPPKGGVVGVALPAQPDTLDPANAVSVGAEGALRPLFDGLVQFGPNFLPRPALAERWVVSPDGLLYTFFLRRGVTFQDGTPFNAQAAKYNLDRLIGPERPRRRELLAGVVREARAPESYSLEVVLDRPFVNTLHLFAQYGAAMVSPEAHRTWGPELGKHPVGTGPFRFVEVARGDRIVLERWDQSWRGRPAVDRLTLTGVPDASARLLLLEADEVQLGGQISSDLVSHIAANQALAAEVEGSARVFGIAINTQARPLTDARVRQALNHAIDRDALVLTVFDGLATPLSGAVSPTVRGAANLPPYPYNPIRARQLLAEAGYPSNLELPLVASRGRYPRDADLARAVQRQLQTVGLKIRLDLLESAAYTTEITKPPSDVGPRLALMSWLPSSGEVRGALYPLFYSSQVMPRGQNASFYQSPLFDGLLDRASQSADADEATIWFREAQELLQQDAPWIFLVSPRLIAARANSLHEPYLAPSELVTASEKTWLE